MIDIEALTAFQDNYIWLLQNREQRRCAVVDPGDASPVLHWLSKHPGWQLCDILITHHHADHIGGVEPLKAATGARVIGPDEERIPGRDATVRDGDRVEVLGSQFETLEVPGHTRSHVAYFQTDGDAPRLFCGDTLFAAGCGRIFEGTPEQMYRSLQRLAVLPDSTLIYCAHEYTQNNLRFAEAVEPENPALVRRIAEVKALRASGQGTLPSNLALERQTNPFLRAETAAVMRAAARHARSESLLSAVQTFAALREWKDHF